MTFDGATSSHQIEHLRWPSADVTECDEPRTHAHAHTHFDTVICQFNLINENVSAVQLFITTPDWPEVHLHACVPLSAQLLVAMAVELT